jgi:dodecin
MAVASVSKITAASPTSFDAAVQEGLARASKTLRGITGLHVIEQKASVKDGRIDEYRVTMEVTFILDRASRGLCDEVVEKTRNVG